MKKSPTRKSPPPPSEQPQPRHRNAYDCEDEYEFPLAQHWTASEAERDDDQTRNWEEDYEDVVGWCRFRVSRGFLLTGVVISVLHGNHLAWELLRLHY
jgi:hypothetical protein